MERGEELLLLLLVKYSQASYRWQTHILQLRDTNKRDYILIPSMTEYYQASHKMAVLHCSSPRLGGIVLTPTYNWYTILPGIAPSTKT